MLTPKQLTMAKEVAMITSKYSKDKSTKVGACIVAPGGAIISTGYNGFPRSVNDDVINRQVAPDKYNWTVHAEQNALMNILRTGSQIPKGSVLVTTHYPCNTCMGLILQCGRIKEVCVIEECMSEDFKERWKESLETSKQMSKETKACTIRMI